MRFGRRARGRNREPIWARREGVKSSGEGSVGIPTEGSAAPAMDIFSDDIDTSTQEILTHLGRFSREYSKPENALWSDACMNQLILCIEIAIEESWSDLTMVLSDTGRVLQTYENAERPEGSIAFLEKAYEVMCRLIGDIVIEKAPLETLEDWSRVYSEGISVLQSEGLELLQDDEGNGDADAMTDDAAEEKIQLVVVDMDVESQAPASTPGDRDELPVLDELPPLESLVTISAVPESESEREPEAEQESEQDPEPVYVSVEEFPEEVAVEDTADPELATEEAGETDVSESNIVEELNFAAFEMPRAKTPEADTEVESEAMPVIEETEEAVEEDQNAASAEKEEQADAEDVKDVEETAPDGEREEIDVYDPPRIVVDIIDRICGVLGDFESDESADRSAGLDVLLGGVKALEREAHLMDNIQGELACAEMKLACLTVHRYEACWSERFLELGFAFCGIFIEALTDPECENVTAWRKDCESWLNENQPDELEEPTEASGVIVAFPPKAEDVTPNVEDSTPAPQEEKNDDADYWEARVVSSSDEADEGDGLSLFSSESQEADVISEVGEAVEESDKTESPLKKIGEAGCDAGESEPVEEVDHAELSQSLLQSAQKAALEGKSEDAKTFALRAAAEIAKSEVQKAESGLRESEMKLKEGIVNSEEARAGVKSCEESVRESSELVADSRKTHGEAQAATGRVKKSLEDLESDVADLNRQIQDMQAKRDEEVENISQTMGKLESVHAVEQQASNELEELSRLEEDGRSRLEESRQIVKDKQRVIQVIESEMERARETLTQEKVSYADITQAIQQISGGTIQYDDGSDGLLF